MKTDIKGLIKTRGYTLKAVAELAGISKQAMNSIVNGNPTISTLEIIADAIGCTLSEFLTVKQQSSNSLTCPRCGAKLNVNLSLEDADNVKSSSLHV